jgi:hypothetical protein
MLIQDKILGKVGTGHSEGVLWTVPHQQVTTAVVRACRDVALQRLYA